MHDVYHTMNMIDQNFDDVSNLTKFLYDLPEIMEFRKEKEMKDEVQDPSN